MRMKFENLVDIITRTALRRNPEKSVQDEVCDEVLGTGKLALQKLMSKSDYVVCSAPSTVETRGMVNADAFRAAKSNQVFINLGRGPVIDEDALIESLKNGTLRGAALDVFAAEPLPEDSELWDLESKFVCSITRLAKTPSSHAFTSRCAAEPSQHGSNIHFHA